MFCHGQKSQEHIMLTDSLTNTQDPDAQEIERRICVFVRLISLFFSHNSV